MYRPSGDQSLVMTRGLSANVAGSPEPSAGRVRSCEVDARAEYATVFPSGDQTGASLRSESGEIFVRVPRARSKTCTRMCPSLALSSVSASLLPSGESVGWYTAGGPTVSISLPERSNQIKCEVYDRRD